MITISIEDAQAKLPELIGGLAKGEELVITEGIGWSPGSWGNCQNAGNVCHQGSPKG